MFVARRPQLRLASVLAVASAMSGCSNLLGLEGLSYEEPPAKAVPADNGDVTALGGSGGTVNVPDEPTFPALFGPGLLVAGSSEALGTYYAYDPNDGALTVRQGASSTLPLREDTGAPGWNLVHGYSDEGGSRFVGYDAESGLTETGFAPSASSAWSGQQAAGTPGWTSLTTVTIDDVPHALVYSAATGSARVGAWAPDSGGLDTTTLSWPPGLSDVAAADIGGESGIVRFAPETELLEFVAITSAGVGATTALTPLPVGTTRVVALPRGLVTTEVDPALATVAAPDANARLLAYNRDDGSMTLLHVEDDGALHVLASAVHRAGLDAIVPLNGAKGPFALLYSAETGVADAMSLEPFAETPPIIIR